MKKTSNRGLFLYGAYKTLVEMLRYLVTLCNDPLISCSGIMTKGKYDEYRDDRRNQTMDSKA